MRYFNFNSKSKIISKSYRLKQKKIKAYKIILSYLSNNKAKMKI